MPIGSTISGQLGLTIETTPGTRIAPATWKQILDESLSANQERITPNGIGGGSRLMLASIATVQKPGGDINMDLAAENVANILRMWIGTPVTTGSGPYVHTYSPLMTAPLSSATIQVGRPDTGATVRAFDYVGSRANSWELTIAPGEIVKTKTSILAEYVDTAQTLGTPTWPTLTFFSSSAHATLSVLGSSECIDNLTLTGNNNLTADNPICATNPGRQRIIDAGFREYGGSFGKNFESLTFYNAFAAGTVGNLVLTLNAGASAQLVITTRVQFEEDNTPVMTGAGQVIKQTTPFRVVRETTDATAFTAVLTTTTATAA